MKIAIRADASTEIGTGHIMRCLTLANALRETGAEIFFLCRPHAGNIVDLVCDQGYQVFCLEYPSQESDNLLLHSNWLGSTQKQDAQQCVQYLKDNIVDWIVVDHYSLDETWELELQPYCRNLMVIDDLSDRRHICDIILDQNFGSTKKKYQHLVPESSYILAGSDFTLLRPEFAEWRQYSLKRRQLPKIDSLLINLGGVDADNITAQLILQLEFCDLPEKTSVTVVLGATAPHFAEVERVANDSKYSVTVIVAASNMAQIMSNSDLAIGAAGSTTWERCCLGLPTILVAIADNQQLVASSLAQVGAAQVINQVSELPDQINSAKVNLVKLSTSSIQISDGQGALRVSRFITESYFGVQKHSLIPYTALTQEQSMFVLEMRNHQEIRQWMHNKCLISKSEHLLFIKGLIFCKDKRFFLVQRGDKILGAINFTDINLKSQKAQFGIFANPFLDEKGRGKTLTTLALQYATKTLNLTNLDLVVIPDNKLAINLYKKFGFIQVRESVENNQTYLNMTKVIVKGFNNEN